MARNHVPPRLGRWSSVANICPDCVPDENDTFDLRACVGCLSALIQPVIESDACPVCSQVLSEGGSCKYWECPTTDRPYGRVHAIGYRHKANILNRLFIDLKFRGAWANAVPLAALLLDELVSKEDVYSNYDLIFPVPRTAAKRELEGDPLGEIFSLAKRLVTTTGAQSITDRMINLDDQVLEKNLETGKSPDMSYYEKKARALAILHGDEPCPYEITDPSRVEGMTVLVVDDIFTSGYHTAYPVGHALRLAGIQDFDLLVIGRQMATD